MIERELRPAPDRVFALVLETGEEAVGALTAFAERRQLRASHFTGIGAFQEVVLAFYDLDRKEYLEIPLPEQVEVVSLAGNVTRTADGGWKVHAHAAVGRRRGEALAGHLLSGRVRPTLEVFLTETPGELRRRPDEETGLALIR